MYRHHALGRAMGWFGSCPRILHQLARGLGWVGLSLKKVKVAHTRLPSVGFWSWSRFLAVSQQVTWVINPAVGCHYFPPGPQSSRELLPICCLVHDGCEQFAWDCYPTASRLRFEPRPFCAWVQHTNHSATEPPLGWVSATHGVHRWLRLWFITLNGYGA